MIRRPMLALTALALVTTSCHWIFEFALPRSGAHGHNVPVVQAEAPAPPEAVVGPVYDESEMQQRIQMRRDFATYTDGIVEQLAGGNLGLHQARDRVLYYCLAHYPDYLNHVQIIEHGKTLKHKLACCLFRFVKDHNDLPVRSAASLETLGHLEAELNQILREEEPEAAHTSAS
jgi:hypothetical protein